MIYPWLKPLLASICISSFHVLFNGSSPCNLWFFSSVPSLKFPFHSLLHYIITRLAKNVRDLIPLPPLLCDRVLAGDVPWFIIVYITLDYHILIIVCKNFCYKNWSLRGVDHFVHLTSIQYHSCLLYTSVLFRSATYPFT